MFTNLILSTVLTASSMVQLDTNRTTYLDDNYLVNAAVSSFLIYQDIFTYTRTYYRQTNMVFVGSKTIYVEGTAVKQDYYYRHVSGEANTVAKVFWDNNLWFLGFALATTANMGITSWLNSFDRSKILSSLVTGVINVAEVYAISTWKKNWKIPGEIHAPVLTITF